MIGPFTLQSQIKSMAYVSRKKLINKYKFFGVRIEGKSSVHGFAAAAERTPADSDVFAPSRRSRASKPK